MPLRPDQFDANGYLLLTAEEWRKKHRDFKSIRSDGTKVCNWLDPKTGATMSVPVRVVKELPPLTNPRRRKTMAKRRRTTQHRRDRRGRFVARGRRRTAKRAHRTRRASRAPARLRSAGASRSGSSSTRMLTLLGLGAAAIFLTKRMTAPPAAAAARIARNRTSSPASPPMDASQSTGPTLPDGTNV